MCDECVCVHKCVYLTTPDVTNHYKKNPDNRQNIHLNVYVQSLSKKKKSKKKPLHNAVETFKTTSRTFFFFGIWLIIYSLYTSTGPI